MHRRFIKGRPYLTYVGCMCNPHWLAMLKSMVRKAIELGLDGFNAHHNYVGFCHCGYCQDYVRSQLQQQWSSADVQRIFGAGALSEVEDVLSPRPECAAEVQKSFELTLGKLANRRRKEAFDEIFIECGRALKPELMLAQWYHKYDFRPHDERSLLPGALWAKDEDYIWYSQGPNKGASSIAQGYLADMGLPARFIYAAGGGKPYVINKYDYRRWRVWCAEAAAHHGAALAYHAGPPRGEQETSANIAPEDYCGPVIRYQRFLAAHESLLHPARPWSQIALVYPRRSELEGEMDCLDALKRLGQLLEDRHLLFDIVLDEQLGKRAADYDMLVLPEVKRLTREEGVLLQGFVEKGGRLVFTGETGDYQIDGQPHARGLLADWRVQPAQGACAGQVETGQGQVLYIPKRPWGPDLVEVQNLGGAEMPVYPPLAEDSFGQVFLQGVEELLGRVALETDAPWFVRVRAWQPRQIEALVLHWINYHQDEDAAIEIPFPVGPLRVECEVPAGYTVDRVEWLYPEMSAPLVLEYESLYPRVCFTIPTLIVYGMSALHLKKERDQYKSGEGREAP